MIHQYKLNGYNIVLDVYSGSVHLVDEVAYDIIALYETTPQEEIVAQMLAKYGHRDDVDEGEILDCLADIQALKQAGKLFSQDLWKDVEQEAFQHTKPVLKAMCLHVAHTCNLNCDYCFASQGNYHGDRGLMPFPRCDPSPTDPSVGDFFGVFPAQTKRRETCKVSRLFDSLVRLSGPYRSTMPTFLSFQIFSKVWAFSQYWWTCPRL